MAAILSVVGSLAVLALVVCGLLFIVAPQYGWKALKKAGTMFLVLLVTIVFASTFIHAVHLSALLVALIVMSPVAYFIREKRLRRPEAPPTLKGNK
jgi:Ca2+/Na+ antiporter